MTEQELHFAERLGAARTNEFLLEHLPDLPVSESTLLRLHSIHFGEIHHWGGRYRDRDVVIGRREWPTLPAVRVPETVQAFFTGFYNPALRLAGSSLQLLTEALVEFHAKLAWFHPFDDGNGRIIRLLCQIMAYERGYWLDWSGLDTSKGRRAYHYAVRMAAQRNRYDWLRWIIRRGLYPVAR